MWNRLRYVKNPETGKRVSRINPPEEWIVREVPELRIVDDDLWRAVKHRQGEIAEQYATVIEATQSARANRLNGAHRPRHLLSGLLECDVCGGPYSMRGQDRYGCSNHVMTGTCSNGRGIRRTVIEDRVLSGLKDRLMAPEAAAEAMKAYVEETNRINRERRASGASDRKDLAVVKHALLTPRNPARSMGYRADRHRTRAPINTQGGSATSMLRPWTACRRSTAASGPGSRASIITPPIAASTGARHSSNGRWPVQASATPTPPSTSTPSSSSRPGAASTKIAPSA